MLASLSAVFDIAQIYLAIALIMSMVTFTAYGWDKRAAENETWRVSEKSLHILGLLGGWPGALAGQKVFRHKTKKRIFRFITYAIATLHLLALAIAMWRLYWGA